MKGRPATVAMTLALLAAACGEGAHDTGPAAARRPASVIAASAVVQSLAEPIESGGVVVASESAVVSSRVLAPILQMQVRAGDRVRAGAVLITLDARDLAAQGRQANAALTAADQGLVHARSEQAAAIGEQKLAAAWHGRIASLRQRNSATPLEFDEAEARLTSADARVIGAQARVDQAVAALAASRAAADAAAAVESYTVIRAPFDGIVIERLTDPGNLATPGAPLLRIDAGGRLRVDVRIDEARAAFVHAGDPVEVLLDDGARGAPRHQQLEGVVTEVARSVDADQRAFSVKVGLPVAVEARTGTFARVRFRGPARDALLIPSSAIRRLGQVTSVFVVRDGAAHLRLIQAGAVQGDQVEVLAGLDSGELIVTTPPPSLVDGHPVTTAAARGGSRERR